MSISASDVRHLAGLARLGVSEEQVPALVTELNGILAHMAVLADVPLPEVPPHGQVPQPQPLRADTIDADPLCIARETCAPAMREGFFLVPRLATHDDEPLAAVKSTDPVQEASP